MIYIIINIETGDPIYATYDYDIAEETMLVLKWEDPRYNYYIAEARVIHEHLY